MTRHVLGRDFVEVAVAGEFDRATNALRSFALLARATVMRRIPYLRVVAGDAGHHGLPG